jgi:hypothetical protein
MVTIDISNREITSPGLRLMRWKGQTGLVRIVGEARKGFKIIAPPDSAESYLKTLPKDGEIPADALFSETLAIQVV